MNRLLGAPIGMGRPARRLLQGKDNSGLDYSGSNGGREKWIDLDMF